MYRSDEFSVLAIRRLSKGKWIKMFVLKATADFYGWSSVFPDIVDAEAVDYPDGIRPFPRRTDPRNYKGFPLYICRYQLNTSGYPKGLTNRFRVSTNASNLDLVAIAQAVQIDYGWMEAKYSERRTRAKWNAIELPDSYCHLDLRAAP